MDEAARPVTPDTLFDLASLTKPLCTALGFVHLAGERGFDLNQRVGELACCRDWPAHWRNIRITDLLCHASGLPAYREFFRSFAPEQSATNRERLFNMIIHEPPETEPGRRSVYSDLGFVVLGRILEETTGQLLDAFFRETLATPLGIETGIGFRPIAAANPQPEALSIAATEDCPWRGHILQGEVHDEHAWLMGGIAGHAGLFGTASAVADFCIAIIEAYKGRPVHSHLPPETLQSFLNFRTPAGLWSLGFDRPTPGASSSGRHFSANTVGHLGFTGTSFWMDLEREIAVVLLSNRVHYGRENGKIREFRPWFHDSLLVQ